MKELLGLILLSFGLIAPLGIALIGIIVTVIVVRRKQGTRAKWKAGIITVLIFIFIPTWDVILGTAYFHYLCATEGGSKVYKPVELEPEYWNPDGTPRFITTSGGFNSEVLGNRFKISTESRDPIYSWPFRISTTKYFVTDTQANEVLGRYTYFINFGGWFVNNISVHVSGTSCPNERGFFESFLKQVFQRAK
jgi:energy-coupling factor transporter transmembrane protein EcfT